MTNYYFLAGAIFCLLIGGSCTNEKPEKVLPVETVEKASISFNNENLDTLTGTYMGDFGGNDIRIVLTHIGKSHVVGYNILKGLRRNLSGSYINLGDTIQMTLSEPGDNEYDGIFELEIYRQDFSGEGKWKSNSGKISAKTFTLEKLPPFEYVENTDIFDNSNFASAYSWVEDSIGAIRFDDDGSCIYEYYPKFDSKNRVEQKVEIKGSWTIKNNIVKIAWQANSIFPSRISEFEAVKDEYYYFLKNADRELYTNNYY